MFAVMFSEQSTDLKRTGHQADREELAAVRDTQSNEFEERLVLSFPPPLGGI